MNKKVVLILVHVPVWLVALAFVFVFSAKTMNQTDTLSLISASIIIALWLLSSFYVFYSFLVPKYLEKRQYKKFTLHTLFLTLVLIPFAQMGIFALMHYIGGKPTSYESFLSKEFFQPYWGNVAATIFCGTIGTFYRFGIDWFRNIQIKTDLENKNLLSELKTLKSKLNPHFLFNSLNNIDTLIQIDHEQASASLSKLSDLLRYMVYETENNKVLIQQEVDIVEKYIELEKIRLVNPNAVVFNHDITEEVLIPPMLFFPFIENGFKHSNLNNADHYLAISIVTENNQISFTCINSINDKPAQKSNGGMGLKLAEKRLDLLFPKTHKLEIKKDMKSFSVNLVIEIQKND